MLENIVKVVLRLLVSALFAAIACGLMATAGNPDWKGFGFIVGLCLFVQTGGWWEPVAKKQNP